MQLSEQAFQTPFPPQLLIASLLPPGPAPPPFCGGREHPSHKVIYGGKALRTDRLRVRKPAQESQSGATEESKNPAVTPSCVPELARGGHPTRSAIGGMHRGTGSTVGTGDCGCHPQGRPWVTLLSPPEGSDGRTNLQGGAGAATAALLPITAASGHPCPPRGHRAAAARVQSSIWVFSL